MFKSNLGLTGNNAVQIHSFHFPSSQQLANRIWCSFDGDSILTDDDSEQEGRTLDVPYNLEPYGHMEPDVYANYGDPNMPLEMRFLQTAEYRRFVMSLCSPYGSYSPG
jgi:hypothetical protein